MDKPNPFKQIEPDVTCPPRLKGEVLSEVDFIRNTLRVVEVYGYDIFSVFTTFLSGLMPDEDTPA